MSDDALCFQATINKLQTTVDGGTRLTLDLVDPVQAETVTQLWKAKQPGIVLEIAAVAIPAAIIEQKKTDDRKKPRKAEKNTRDSGTPY